MINMKDTAETPAIRAMLKFQKDMEGEAERTGLTSDDAITELVMEARYGEKKENTES